MIQFPYPFILPSFRSQREPISTSSNYTGSVPVSTSQPDVQVDTDVFNDGDEQHAEEDEDVKAACIQEEECAEEADFRSTTHTAGAVINTFTVCFFSLQLRNILNGGLSADRQTPSFSLWFYLSAYPRMLYASLVSPCLFSYFRFFFCFSPSVCCFHSILVPPTITTLDIVFDT